MKHVDSSPSFSPSGMAQAAAGAGSGLRRWMPGLHRMLGYRASWLRHDLAAGLAVAAVTVPVSIAYAVAAGLPAVYGLYATITPSLVYALLGPSRILMVGPNSALAAIILAVVAPMSHGDPAHAVALAGMMAVVTGMICAAAGLARLGFITELLSKPIRVGFMNGIAVIVLASQLPALFGFSVSPHKPLPQLWAFCVALWRGGTNGLALFVGLCVLGVIALLRKRNIPAVLVAVAAAAAAGALFDLPGHGLSVLGALPRGLPWPVIPDVAWDELGAVLMGGMAAAVFAFSSTSVLSRSYAARLGERVDPNAEMVGLGMANFVTGFFQGFPVCASTSRTPVAEAAGARTQLAGIVSALAVFLMLLLAPGLLASLPTSALAAVVIASVAGLIEVSALRHIYQMQRWEFWLSMVCFGGVVVLGPIPGIGLAIAVAVVEFLWDAWRPHYAVLGRVSGMKGYHDVLRYPQARLLPGLVLFRWDAPLFFANAEWFHSLVSEAVKKAPGPVRWLVVAAEPVTNVDVTAADMLAELDKALRQQGVKLHFAEMKDPVKDKLKRFGLFSRFGEQAFFPTLGQAVSSYRRLMREEENSRRLAAGEGPADAAG